jgi:hypothetical protein
MFIRGRERIAEVWPRFQVPTEGFVVAEHRGIFEARVVANADRILGLFLELSRHLQPRVAVHLDDVRHNAQWGTDDVALVDARSEVRRVRSVLAAYAGVECSLFDEADQLTLTAHLEIFTYATTERWYYFLRDLGLPRYRSMTVRSWRPDRDEFPPAPPASTTVSEMVAHLGLRDRSPA